jgi:hypothetical protein
MSEHERPWYCSDRAVDEYRDTLNGDSPIPMLKRLKVLRAIVGNIALAAMGGYLGYLGADPTWLAVLYFGSFAAYNGLEISDYVALLRAIQEAEINTDNE